jgi:hypothetical protein
MWINITKWQDCTICGGSLTVGGTPLVTTDIGRDAPRICGRCVVNAISRTAYSITDAHLVMSIIKGMSMETINCQLGRTILKGINSDSSTFARVRREVGEELDSIAAAIVDRIVLDNIHHVYK